jgi:hypothetical protein
LTQNRAAHDDRAAPKPGVTVVMKCKSILAAVAACAAAAFAGVPAASDILLARAYAQSGQPGKVVAGRNAELRRGGYYSYGAPEGQRRSNAHLAPMVDLQSRAGPFDSGFFFDSGLRPHRWNNAPYPN